MWTKQPFQKGSVLEALILTCKQEGLVSESTEMSRTLKWRAGEKLAKLGTVNSADLRKPRKVRLHAALNVQWSKMDKSKDPKMIIKMSSVMEDAELQRNLGSV